MKSERLHHNSGFWCLIAGGASTEQHSGMDNHHRFYCYTFYFIPLILSFVAIAVNMGLLPWTVWRSEWVCEKDISCLSQVMRNGALGRAAVLLTYTLHWVRESSQRSTADISSLSRNEMHLLLIVQPPMLSPLPHFHSSGKVPSKSVYF